MAKTRSMTRNQDHDGSSSSGKRFKSFDKGGVGLWSDLNDDVLFIVMMQLEFVDFLAFSGVCKSWRSFALSSRNTFMASKPPMKICNYDEANKDDWCSFHDIEGNNFNTMIPHFTGRACVGSTCGYLILFGRETQDFWLVNPVTKHELHFPGYSSFVTVGMRGILVFSPSISGWVFVVLNKNISFSIAGSGAWESVSSTIRIVDLHVFKGKIYTLHGNCTLSELRLHPNQNPKWMLLEATYLPNPDLLKPRFVSSSDNLYVISNCGGLPRKLLELDVGEMKWVSPDKSVEECAFFFGFFSHSVAVNTDSWFVSRTKHKSYNYFLDDDRSRKCLFYYAGMWYFPHDYSSVYVLDE